MRTAAILPLLCAALVVPGGCDWMPGKPKRDEVWHQPSADLDFHRLYRMNCLACHSDGTTLSAARPMNDPVYLALVGPDELRRVIAEGVPGTNMPGYDEAVGGPLTAEQIDVLVKGIMGWKNPAEVPNESMPPYAAALGDAVAGKATYGVFCAHCHGPDGAGGSDGGSIVDPAYLGLVSDQALRTAVIAGRKDLGMPNWTDYVPGRVMTDGEIADVVAWMVAQRPTPADSDTSLPEQTPNRYASHE